MKEKIDYREELENVARQMIVVNKVDTLAKLILKTILKNMLVTHAGILLLNKRTNEYIALVSEGDKGKKVPVGFTKLKKDNPLITYFTDPKLSFLKRDFLLNNRINYYLNSGITSKKHFLKGFLTNIKNELSLYQAKAFVPGFYRNDLVGLLFVGEKEDKKSFSKEELGFLSVLASDVVMAVQNSWLFDDLSEQLNINKNLFLNTVTALATAIEAKDKYTSGHTERVVEYSLAITKYLDDDRIRDNKDFVENLRISALLHDIGKIGISERILNKKEPLTDIERALMSKHPIIGGEIIMHINEFMDVVDGVKYHHEFYNGKGYPYGLSGDEIPLAAQIISVSDAFDAMTSNRPYRNALSKDDAIEQIKINSGKQFNPVVVEAFLKVMLSEMETVTTSRKDLSAMQINIE